jgi:hypothetical protein
MIPVKSKIRNFGEITGSCARVTMYDLDHEHRRRKFAGVPASGLGSMV